VEGFDERQVFRARDNSAYLHEYDISTLERWASLSRFLSFGS
jgi:hypothetical protein